MGTKRTTLRHADIRSIVRLIGDIGALPHNPEVRTAHTIAGIQTLTGASFVGIALTRWENRGLPTYLAWWATGRQWGKQEIATFEALASNAHLDPTNAITQRAFDDAPPGQPATFSRSEFYNENQWRRIGFVMDYHRPIDAGDSAYSMFPQANGIVQGLAITRPWGDRCWTPREKQMLALLHQGLFPLLPRDVDPPAAGPDRMADGTPLPHLSPRESQVLQMLLRGDGLKQVAAALGLSKNTVNDYVKAVYKGLHVNSRAELLARFISQASVTDAAGKNANR